MLEASKLKESADENFKCDENDESSPKRLIAVGKGDIARYEQFLFFFPRCFRKTYTADL